MPGSVYVWRESILDGLVWKDCFDKVISGRDLNAEREGGS